jgi:hypothetical protein
MRNARNAPEFSHSFSARAAGFQCFGTEKMQLPFQPPKHIGDHPTEGTLKSGS